MKRVCVLAATSIAVAVSSFAARPLYVPDEKRESIPTAEGLEVRAMTERKAILALPELDRSLPPCGWDTKPLGAPGALTYPTELSRKPVFRAPPISATRSNCLRRMLCKAGEFKCTESLAGKILHM